MKGLIAWNLLLGVLKYGGVFILCLYVERVWVHRILLAFLPLEAIVYWKYRKDIKRLIILVRDKASPTFRFFAKGMIVS